MAETTSLRLPSTLPFPITITRVLQHASAELRRGTPLLEYSFVSDELRKSVASGKVERAEDDMVGSWESPIEGMLVDWENWVGRGVTVDRREAGKTALRIEQPCTHPVQLHGLCAVCGKEVTESDYLSRNSEAGPSANGGFEMGHDALGVTVSSDEARRLDTQGRDALLSSRKLALIVDLDQTIIHTTVDPTVWEWMQEIKDSGPSTTPPGSPGASGPSSATPSRKRKRESNPNAEALRDVAMFQLEDEPAPGEAIGPRRRTTMRTYFTKPRPGLDAFLDRMSELYEMHVYTMGTRSYADAIVKIVDPNDKIFGGRILSRDESGSFTAKSLTRLFPTDQSMVVVIDDRSDVWAEIPNLVKVVPYDFFVGIGDINSSFLPPTPKPPGGDNPSAPTVVAEDGAGGVEEVTTDSEEDQMIRQKKLLDQMSEERPLAKMQERLEHEAESGADGGEAPSGEEGGANGGVPEIQLNDEAVSESSGSSEAPEGEKRSRPLLKTDDRELDRVAKILRDVHRAFYRAYDQRDIRAGNSSLPLGCDVELIIPEIKSRTFAGCNIVFSGVIPRHIEPESSDVWRTAESFGAMLSLKVTRSTTHCVTAVMGTEKTYYAAKYGAKVVWVKWFNECVALWKKLDEGPFLAKSERNGGTEESSGGPTPNGDDPRDQPTGDVNGADGDGQGMDVDPEGDESRAEEDYDTGNWNEDDDKELADFFGDMAESEMASDAGSRRDSPAPSVSPSPPPSTPGGRKRVRYADEEHLPLESFREPDAASREYVEQMQAKHGTPLLLMPAKEGEVGEENRMLWKGKMRDHGGLPIESAQDASARSAAPDGSNEHGAPGSTEEESAAEDGDGEDEFAKMLLDELGD